MSLYANFDIVHDLTDPDFLVVMDMGPHEIYPTITNSAETVVRELTSRGLLWPGRRFLYLDSLGQLDEIVHDGRGAFRCFRALSETERNIIDPKRILPRC